MKGAGPGPGAAPPEEPQPKAEENDVNNIEEAEVEILDDEEKKD